MKLFFEEKCTAQKHCIKFRRKFQIRTLILIKNRRSFILPESLISSGFRDFFIYNNAVLTENQGGFFLFYSLFLKTKRVPMVFLKQKIKSRSSYLRYWIVCNRYFFLYIGTLILIKNRRSFILPEKVMFQAAFEGFHFQNFRRNRFLIFINVYLTGGVSNHSPLFWTRIGV